MNYVIGTVVETPHGKGVITAVQRGTINSTRYSVRVALPRYGFAISRDYTQEVLDICNAFRPEDVQPDRDWS